MKTTIIDNDMLLVAVQVDQIIIKSHHTQCLDSSQWSSNYKLTSLIIRLLQLCFNLVNWMINSHPLQIWIFLCMHMSTAFCPRTSLPQSINRFKSQTQPHSAFGTWDPRVGNAMQKCLITAAFQIKWRRCIIHLWRIPRERGPAGKQEVWDDFCLPAT